ncbi:MAG: DUF2490 domain-containing protein [Bacteroidota bacterium]
MKKIYRKIPALILFLAMLPPAAAQSQQQWFTFNYRILANDTINYDIDVGSRHLWQQDYWHQDYIRASARYFINQNNSVLAGLAYFRVSEYDQPNVHEIRPFQAYKMRGFKMFSNTFNHYLRLEERLKFGDFPLKLNFRFRYRIQTAIPLFELWRSRDLVSFQPSVESFFDIGKSYRESFVDRYRVGFGIIYDISERFRLDFTYIYMNNMDTYMDGVTFDTHIARLRLTINDKFFNSSTPHNKDRRRSHIINDKPAF